MKKINSWSEFKISYMPLNNLIMRKIGDENKIKKLKNDIFILRSEIKKLKKEIKKAKKSSKDRSIFRHNIIKTN